MPFSQGLNKHCFETILGRRVYSSLYCRLRDMEKQGLIKTRKQRHYRRVDITEKGEMGHHA